MLEGKRKGSSKLTCRLILLVAAVTIVIGMMKTLNRFNNGNKLWEDKLQMLETLSASNNKDQQDNKPLKDGWHTIQVFYGDQDLVIPNRTNNDEMWFSQVQQDEIVAALLRNKRNGYFIDLAANDAVTLSNTLALERQFGWKGLCIEANPEYWRGLSFRDCQVVAAAVGKNRKERVNFNLENVFGGIISNAFDNKEGSHKGGKATPYYTVPLAEILERNNAPSVIDYFSLDVEGAESYIMDDFPFDKYTVRIMTVERPKPVLKQKLRRHGYKLLRKISKFGETVWVHESFVDSLDLASLEKFNSY